MNFQGITSWNPPSSATTPGWDYERKLVICGPFQRSTEHSRSNPTNQSVSGASKANTAVHNLNETSLFACSPPLQMIDCLQVYSVPSLQVFYCRGEVDKSQKIPTEETCIRFLLHNSNKKKFKAMSLNRSARCSGSMSYF